MDYLLGKLKARPYRYRPLDRESGDIRLVTLLPQADRRYPQCTLAHVSLDNNPPKYEALSYVWASAMRSSNIYLDGRLIEVGANLCAGLRAIQTTGPRILWIDALCINQSDTAERACQVRQMGRIYSSAARVVVWLGNSEADQGVTEIFNILGDPCNTVVQDDIKDHDFQYMTVLKCIKRDFPEIVDSDNRSWVHLASIFTNEWFYRVWTLQEFVLSKDAIFYAGSCSFTWDRLETFSNFWKRVKNVEQSSLASTRYISRNLYQLSGDFAAAPLPHRLFNMRGDFQSGKSVHFLEILSAAKGRDATNPVGKLFSLQGLLADTETNIIDVNYQKSSLDVAKSCTKASIRTYKRLDILLLAGTGHRNGNIHIPRDHRGPPCLPSWCPNYGLAVKPRSGSPYTLLDQALSNKSWQAGGTSFVPVGPDLVDLHDPQALTLTVQAILLEPVAQVYSRERTNPRSASYMKAVREGQFTQSPPLITPDMMPLGTEHWEPAVEYSFFRFLDRVEELDRSSVMGGQLEKNIPPPSGVECNAFGQSFVSKACRFGKGPPRMLPGDMLCVIPGACCPFIIRKIERREDEWNFIGACYVIGIMSGEILQEIEDGKRMLQEIVLR